MPERRPLRRALRPGQQRPDRWHAPTPTSTRPRAGTSPASRPSPAPAACASGIVDTGIDQSHPDLAGKTAACAQSLGLLIFAGQIKEGSCADDNDHGSHVAGTIAANANNGVGVAGVAFDAQLVICKALGGPLGTGTTADVANCIGWVHAQRRAR